MDIKFQNTQLELIETDKAAETNLPVTVIRAARHQLNILRAAPDMRTLQNWRSLGLHTCSNCKHLVHIPPHWVMILDFKEKKSGMQVVVIRIEEQTRGTA